MIEKREKQSRSIRENVFFLFGLLMAVVYLAIGIVAIVVPEFLADYHKSIKSGIGVLFIAYSFFRFYRTIKKYRSHGEDIT